MQALSIAQNKDTFFISIDKHKVSKDKLDNSAIKPVSDEEQAEIEAILEAISEEDKEIAFTEIVEFEI